MSGPVKIDNTMGMAFIGVVVAASLWGVSCLQVWYYYRTYLTDPWYIKLLVAAVLTFDTVHQILITHAVYTYLVTNFGNVVELGNLVWSLVAEVLFNGFTALLVQCFLTMRVWRFSNKNYILTGLVLSLFLAEFICVIIYVVKGLQMTTFAELTQLKHLSITVNVLAAAGDVLIAIVLCSMLHKSRTGLKKSDTMITKLIIFTMNTGLLTSICAVASLISITAAGTTFIYITFFFCIGRLYSNSLMAILNARQSIRDMLSDETISISLGDIQQSGGIAAVSKVDTTLEFTRDGDSADPELFRTDQKIDLEHANINIIAGQSH